MSDEYRRQIDLWIKISVIVVPLMSIAMSWGFNKAVLSAIDSRVSRIEVWISTFQGFMLDEAKANVKAGEQQSEMNRRLERIEVILDSRLSRK